MDDPIEVASNNIADKLLSQFFSDPSALNFLLQKLKVGNLRISNLNCIPGRSSHRLGLSSLDKLDTSCTKEFLDELFSMSKFSFKLTIPENFFGEASEEKEKEYRNLQGITRRRLNNMSYEIRNEFQEYGTKSFGFGYPIVLIRDSRDRKKVLAAPLVIWYLDIMKDTKLVNSWKIQKDESNPIIFNEILFNYLKEHAHLNFDDIRELQESVLEDEKLDCDELKTILSIFMKKLNAQGGSTFEHNSQIINLENKERADSLLNEGSVALINNGVFTFYKTYKQNIINDLDYMIKNIDDISTEGEEDNSERDQFSAVKTDPSQSHLLESLASNKNLLVQGPPGTGKSQSITAIITNALKNEKKCLVVCEKKTAMDVIYQNLKNIGLGNFAMVIDDPITDRNKVIKEARNEYENLEYSYNQIFDLQNSRYQEFVQILKDFHKEKNTPIINNLSRRDLISEVLKGSSCNPNHFKPINKEKFKLDSEEFNNLQTVVNDFTEKSKFLEKNQELLQFSSEITENDYKAVKVKISEDIEKVLEILISLKAGLVRENYIKNVENLCQKDKASILKIISEIRTNFDILEPRIQSNLLKNSCEVTLPEKLGSFVSQMFKKILKFKRKLGEQLDSLNEIASGNPFLDIAIKKIEKTEKLEEIKFKIIDSENTLLNEKLIEDVCKRAKDNFRLSDDNFFHQKEWSELLDKIKSLNDILDGLYLINKNQYLINIEDSVLEFQQKVENNRKLFSQLKLELDYFRDYYNLWEFISSRDQKSLIILKIMIKEPNLDWMKIFKQWYIESVLEKKSGKNPSDSEHAILELLNIRQKAKEIYPQIIDNYWKRKVYSDFHSMPSRVPFKSIYNLKGSKGEHRNSLKIIVQYNFDLFTDIFPVVLTNPNTVSTIFPMKSNLFDIVIFDEASQLKIEDTITSLVRGTHRIVSGDRHQMPPSTFFMSDVDAEDVEEEVVEKENTLEIDELERRLQKNQLLNLVTSESLLEFAEQANFKEVFLDIHYRSRHPDLIEFSNKAFYGSRLLPAPAKEDYVPITFWQEEGIYNSADNNNAKEAEKVIELIKYEYKKDPNNTIGVATLNLRQRNLINDLIALKSVNDRDFLNMMDHLYENGFFVKNLENIQGDERDVIIISTTFGKTEKGTFIQNYGPINKKNGYRLLNVIITRAKKSLHLITSIPDAYYMKYEDIINKNGNNGTGIFYAYIAYARAVSEKDKATKENILKIIAGNSDLSESQIKMASLTESPFEEEVFQRMLKYIPEDKIELQGKVGGFRIDIVIDTKTPGKRIAVECDGATYHGSEDDYQWDMFRQEYLENFGYIFHRIWSEDWWEDPESEMRKLVKFVEENNGYIISDKQGEIDK